MRLAEEFISSFLFQRHNELLTLLVHIILMRYGLDLHALGHTVLLEDDIMGESFIVEEDDFLSGRHRQRRGNKGEGTFISTHFDGGREGRMGRQEEDKRSWQGKKKAMQRELACGEVGRSVRPLQDRKSVV